VRPTFRLLLAAINAPPALIAVAGLLAAYLHPGPFWWAAVAGVLLPYTAMLLAGLAIVMVLLRQRWWASVHVILIVLAVARMGVLDRTGSQLEPSDDDLVVMTFSVPRFGESAEVLAENVFRLLEDEDPHLVALQETVAWRRFEAPGIPRVANYVQLALDSLNLQLAIPARMEGARTPLPVLTDLERGPVILEQEEVSLGDLASTGPTSRYLRTRFRWQGREAVLYNVHLRGYGTEKPWDDERFPALSPRLWLPFVQRYRQAFGLRAREVRELEERLAAEEVPVIIAGDLNVTPANWDYRIFRRGRIDAFRQAGRGWGGTYRGDLPVVRIDYVFADTAFEVVTAHVPNVQFSDHRPVVARIRWATE